MVTVMINENSMEKYLDLTGKPLTKEQAKRLKKVIEIETETEIMRGLRSFFDNSTVEELIAKSQE